MSLNLPKMTLAALLTLTLLSISAKADDDQSTPEFDQKLSELYDRVSANFSANPNFQNAANPEINNPNFTRQRQLPEYVMPSLDTFKVAMKSYCVLLESPAANSVTHREHFGIMDYTQNALIRRFYVYDVPSQSFIHNTWGTHADNSEMNIGYTLDESHIRNESENVLDLNDRNHSRFFSNRGHSEISTLGMTIAQNQTYFSSTFNSDALRIAGVDGNLNSNILGRAIVLHAWGMNSAQTRYSQSMARSEGCLMFSYDDFFEGNSHVVVYKKIIESLYGSPLMLYHERLTNPALNESSHAQELQMYANLQVELATNLDALSEQYHLSAEEKATANAFYSKKLKADALAKIEETYLYFKTASRYIGKSPRSENQCLRALGL